MNVFVALKVILAMIIPIGVIVLRDSAEISKIGTQVFQLAEGANPNAPLSYLPHYNWDPELSCPGSGIVCIIEIFDEDVYTVANAPVPSFIGKPKVGLATEVSYDIADAIASGTDPYISPSGRIIWQSE